MTYDAWIESANEAIVQYREGIITAYEAFNFVVGAAMQVEQLEQDPAMPCGETNIVRDYNPEAGERIIP